MKLVDSCSSVDVSLENFLYSLFMCVVLFISAIGNIIVVVVVMMSNSLKRRSTFYFIASLGKSHICFQSSTIVFNLRLQGPSEGTHEISQNKFSGIEADSSHFPRISFLRI